MKKSKKLRVSWASDSLLCQVKMFLKDDCPAKISSHYQSCSKPKAMNILPPGFERTQYASSRMQNKVSHIPRIKWKKPPKFILNGALLIGSGEESKETRDENLRIHKVLEAFYPHRSLVPNRPSVSLAVEVERYDDSKTPNIRLTPIEDEPEAASFELPSPTKEVLPPAIVSGLGPELSLALTALMTQNKEQGSNIDADFLVKLLSDPNIVKNLLMNGTKGKPLETANINITKPSLVPQHVTSSSSSAMDIRNPSPEPIAAFPRNGLSRNVPVSVQSTVSVATTDQPLLKPIRAMSSIKPCSVFHTYPLSTELKKPLPRPQDSYQTAISRPNPVDAVLVAVSEQKTVPKPQSQSFKVLESARNVTDGLPRNVPVSVQSSVSVATTEPPLPKSSQAMSSVLPMKPSSVVHTYPLSTGMNKPLPRPQESYQTALLRPSSVDAVLVSVSEQKTVPKPPQSQSTRNGTDPQTRNVAYSNDQVSAKPVKSLDYFKNLIREHGGVVIPPQAATKETNNYKGRVQNMKKKKKKVQKQCIYFGRGKGCKLGESCLFLHDPSKRVWPTNVSADFPKEAKRFKFGS